MLEAMHTAVLCGCCAALGLSLAEQILPTERFAKQMRLMVSMLMLLALLRPLTGLDLSAMMPDPAAAEAYSAEIAAMAETARNDAVSERLVSSLNDALEAHSVPCRVLAVRLHNTEEGSIVIDEVIITGNAVTGAVYLHEWLGREIAVTKGEEGDSLD